MSAFRIRHELLGAVWPFLHILVASFSLILVSGCWQAPPAQPLRANATTDEFFIDNWTVLGPFNSSPGSVENESSSRAQGIDLNFDYLQQAGFSEQRLGLNMQALSRLPFARSVTAENGVISFTKLFPKNKYGVAYAYAQFALREDQHFVLALGSGDGAKVWIDNHLLLSEPSTLIRAAFPYTELIPVSLCKGFHLLVIKVDHKGDDWALITSFLSTAKAAQIEVMHLNGALLATRFVRNSTLHFTSAIRRLHLPALLRVSNLRGDVVFTHTFATDAASDLFLPTLSWGVYDITLQSSEGVMRDAFLRSSIQELDDKVKVLNTSRRAAGLTSPAESAAAIQRYHVLRSVTYFRPADADWQRKVLMVARQLQTCLFAYQHNHDYGVPHLGFSFHEYVSPIDSQPQQYLLFTPVHHSPTIPLVLIVPYAEQPTRPFLESSLLAWPRDLDAVATAAERDGVAVVVANGRGTIGDAPIGEADLLQTLAAASRIIPVDATRVYLYGVCEGGRRALLLAEHYPQLFAGVGVYGPVLTPYKQDDASTPWFDRRSVLTLAPNLSNIPVILAWGDLDPEMSPLLAYRFADVLHRSGGTVTPLIIRGGMHKQENLEQSIFPMLVTYTRPTVPYHVHLLVAEPLYTKAYWLSAHSSRYEVGSVDAELNGERVVVKTTGVSSLTLHLNTLAGAPTPTVVLWNGRLFTLHGEPSSSLRLDGAKPALPPPLVASAFASKFLVVRSTRTSGEYLAERAFSQRWKRDFFTPFTSVNDIRVTTPMLARANLIFIGEPKRGTLAESLVHRAFPKLVPLLHTSDAERLVVIRATYNPLHKAGIVVFVHAPPSHWTTKAMDLAIGGRYNDEH